MGSIGHPGGNRDSGELHLGLEDSKSISLALSRRPGKGLNRLQVVTVEGLGFI